MGTNNLKKLRLKQGITQAELANKVGTSQQNIQRIEAGMGSLRADWVLAIAKVLKIAAETIFPELKPRKSNQPSIVLPLLHQLRLDLSAGHKLNEYVSEDEQKRLWSMLSDVEDDIGMVSFEGLHRFVCVNHKHIEHSAFRVDPGADVFKNHGEYDELEQKPVTAIFLDDEIDDESYITIYYLSGFKKQILMDPDFSDEVNSDSKDFSEDEIGVKNFFYDLEAAFDADLKTIVVQDANGEDHIVYLGHVVAATAPMSIVSAALGEAVADGYEEEDTAVKPPMH